MKIPRHQRGSEPDINLIPLIDILLVIVIFLVVSSTFVRENQLRVELPGTQSGKEVDSTLEPLRVIVGKDGNYGFAGKRYIDDALLKEALLVKAANYPELNTVTAIIQADAAATHQSVVTVMDILASIGIAKISIATEAQ